MADNMTAGKRLIDPAPVISKLANRCLHAKPPECSLLGEVIGELMAAPLITHVEQEWIPVTERLPELVYDRVCEDETPEDSWKAKYSEKQIVIMKDGSLEIATYWEYDNGVALWEYTTGCEYPDFITHWMPLPQAPEVK